MRAVPNERELEIERRTYVPGARSGSYTYGSVGQALAAYRAEIEAKHAAELSAARTRLRNAVLWLAEYRGRELTNDAWDELDAILEGP